MFGKSDSHKNYPPNFLHDLYSGKLAGWGNLWNCSWWIGGVYPAIFMHFWSHFHKVISRSIIIIKGFMNVVLDQFLLIKVCWNCVKTDDTSPQPANEKRKMVQHRAFTEGWREDLNFRKSKLSRPCCRWLLLGPRTCHDHYMRSSLWCCPYKAL